MYLSCVENRDSKKQNTVSTFTNSEPTRNIFFEIIPKLSVNSTHNLNIVIYYLSTYGNSIILYFVIHVGSVLI